MKHLLIKSIFAIVVILGAVIVIGLFRSGNGNSSKQSIVGGNAAQSTHDIGAGFSADASIPFTFSTKNLPVQITQHAISPSRDADYILAHYKACGPKYRPQSYFPDTASTMRKLPETAYSVGGMQIILIPNLLGYKNLAALQEDFFACPNDTGVLVPADMNDNWLVFTRSCAATDDTCKQVASVVSSTIHIK